MNIDCQWLEQNLEGYFCERLSPNDLDRANLHIEGCSECRKSIQEFHAIDPLIRQVFNRNLSIARTPRKPRARRLAPVYVGATAAIALAIWAGVKTSKMPGLPPAPQPPQQAVAVAPQETIAPQPPAIVKSQGKPPIERAKPQPAPLVTAPQPSQPASHAAVVDPTEKRAPFLVSDAAGYSRTLSDFRNHVLIFGVWSSHEPRTISALQRLYEIYGSNAKLRILGVSNERQAKPANGTFPVVYNENSQLLGAQPSDIVIVDGTGAVRFRGSLLDNPNNLAKTIRSALEPLGIR